MAGSNKGEAQRPRLHYLSHVHPRLYFCRGAALMRLTNGRDRLVSRAYPPDWKEVYSLYLNGVLLAKAHIPHCGTCATALHVGYGDGLISQEECAAVRDRINAGFDSLKQSADMLAPLVGLMKSGLYLIADMDLFPVRRWGDGSAEYFWDEPWFPDELHFNTFYSVYHQPLYLAPTQRAALMNPAQVEAYRQRIQEGDRFPRAIALYLNGAVSLLLDGHHKAAACAAEGVPVKTLVIFPLNAEQEDDDFRALNPERSLKALESAAMEGKRLYFRDGRGGCDASPLILCDGQDQMLARARCLTETPTRPVEDRELPKIPWGRVPDAYRTSHFSDFPEAGTLENAVELPRDQIRGKIDEMRKAERRCDSDLRTLRAYARLFPDSKWLSASERTWLDEVLD